jgi:hypothetical protein
MDNGGGGGGVSDSGQDVRMRKGLARAAQVRFDSIRFDSISAPE